MLKITHLETTLRHLVFCINKKDRSEPENSGFRLCVVSTRMNTELG